MDLKKIMVNMGILGLFVFGIMSFIITTQSDNDITNKLINNDLMNETYGDLNTELKVSQGRTQNFSNTFMTTTPTQQFGELEINSIVSPTRTIKTMIFGLWNIFIKLPQVILGVSPTVSYIISALLVVLVIIGIWAIWKGAVS